jgi:hypothetical protein
MKKLSLIAAVLLAACSNGSDAPEPGPTTPASVLDAFFAQVRTVVAASPDESEAASIDALAPTAPEDSEPVSL